MPGIYGGAAVVEGSPKQNLTSAARDCTVARLVAMVTRTFNHSRDVFFFGTTKHRI